MNFQLSYSCTTCGIHNAVSIISVENPDAGGKWIKQFAVPAAVAEHRKKSPACRPDTPNDDLIGLSMRLQPLRER
jgi:hypothetical protein